MRQTLLLLLMAMMLTANEAANELRVGAAAVSITPPEGAPLAGYYPR